MITIAKEKEIRTLLQEELSNREIAKRVGIHHTTIARIRKESKLRNRFSSWHLPRTRRRCHPRKCPTCGGKIIEWPCLLCHPQEGYYELELEPFIFNGSNDVAE